MTLINSTDRWTQLCHHISFCLMLWICKCMVRLYWSCLPTIVQHGSRKSQCELHRCLFHMRQTTIKFRWGVHTFKTYYVHCFEIPMQTSSILFIITLNWHVAECWCTLFLKEQMIYHLKCIGMDSVLALLTFFRQLELLCILFCNCVQNLSLLFGKWLEKSFSITTSSAPT